MQDILQDKTKKGNKNRKICMFRKGNHLFFQKNIDFFTIL